MATAVGSRFADEEYKNWLKVGQALLCLRDGLCTFADTLTTQLHKDVLQKCAVNGKSCTQCTSKDVEYKQQNNQYWALKRPCPVDLCDKLLVEIANQHQSMKAKQLVYWKNTNVSKWTTEPWEIAKVYMGKGQKEDNRGPTHTDASNLLILIKQCKYFKSHITGKADIEKVLTMRNAIMHSSTLTVKESEMKKYLCGMINVLEDSKELKDNAQAKEAVDQIRTIEALRIELGAESSEWRDTEVNLLRQKMLAVEERLSDLEEGKDKDQEKEDMLTFLDNNKDLQVVLKDDFQRAFGHLDTRVTDIESKMDRLILDADAVKHQGRSSAESGFDVNLKYKEVLNTRAQKHRITDVKYNKMQDVQDAKWWCTVVYAGKEFKSDQSFNKSGLAEQNAAYQALKGLGFLNKNESPESPQVKEVGNQPSANGLVSTSTPPNSRSNTKTEIPKEAELNALLCRLGFSKCTVELHPQGQMVKVLLKVKVTHCIGLDESIQGKKNATEQVARNILNLLGVPVSDSTKSAKEQLYSHCGINKLKPANYYTCDDLNKNQHFWAYAAIECLNGVSREVCVEGNETESETESLSSAAETMLKVLEGVKLGEVVGSAGVSHSNPVSPQPSPSVPSTSACSNTLPPQQPNPVSNSSLQLNAPTTHNYVSRLYEYCQKNRLTRPEIDTTQGELKGNEFKGLITNYEFKVSSVSGKSLKKKDVEKEAACQALTKVIGQPNPDRNRSKNLLQEYCVKVDCTNLPVYGVGRDGRCEVTFRYHIVGQEWFTEKKNAKADVAKQLLAVLEKIADV